MTCIFLRTPLESAHDHYGLWAWLAVRQGGRTVFAASGNRPSRFGGL